MEVARYDPTAVVTMVVLVAAQFIGGHVNPTRVSCYRSGLT